MTGLLICAWLQFLLTAACLGLLYAATYRAAVLAALLGFLLFAALSQALAFCLRKKAALSLHLPTAGEKNAPLTGTVKETGAPHVPLGLTVCTMEAENTLTGEKTRLFLRLHGDRADFTLIPQHCGHIRVRVHRAFHMGLFALLPCRVPCGASAQTTVLPDTFVTELRIRVPQTEADDSPDYAPDRRGTDLTEPYQMRDYVSGDDLRQIHWKLSEKLEHTVIREASEPVLRTLLVFWDKQGDATQLDAQAEVIFTLTQCLSAQGQPYCLGFAAQGGELRFVEINTSEDCLAALPMLLRGGAMPDALRDYAQTHGAVGFGKLLFLSNAVPEALPDFSGNAAVTLLLCTAQAPQTEHITYCFSPNDYSAALRHLEL